MKEVNNTILIVILLAITLVMSCSNNLNNPEECREKDIPILNCEAKDIPILACKEKDITALRSIALNAEIPLNKLMIYDNGEIFYKRNHFENTEYEILFNSNSDIIALRIRNTKFSNLKLLSILTELEHINLNRNRISKINGLNNLYKLKSLDLSENGISRIENLENLHKLKILDLSENEISRIEGLENLHGLRVLNLMKNEISKIENLENLYFLENLDLSINKISGIINFRGLKKLKSLFISNNEIDIIDFDGLKNIRWVVANFNNISKIKNTKILLNLGDLYMCGNPIYDIEGIENLKRLKRVSIGGNINGYVGKDFSDREYFDDDRADFFVEKLEKMKVEVIKSPHVLTWPDSDIFK